MPLSHVVFGVVALSLTMAPASAQTLSGFVEDAESGERVIGATVVVPEFGRGAVTNAYGFFALAFGAPGPVAVEVRSVGYAPLRDTLVVGVSPVTFRIHRDTTSLAEVSVEAQAEAPPLLPGALRLSARDVEAVPALLGEADPLRVLQLSPAVRFGSEGSTGLHVRGGSPDQTLLLLDGAPVYNAAHLAGAVSVFNSDALSSVALVPGAPPARYGGRLSAVVDVTQREGTRDRRQGTATVGLLSSRALVEGPIAGGRGGYVVSARRSYADALLAPLVWRPGFSTGYYFRDGTAKVNLDLDDRTRVFASAYGGRDRFYRHSEETFESSQRTDREDTAVDWGNVTATARATRVLSTKAFASALVYVSRYGFSAEREASDTFPDPQDPRARSQSFGQSSGLTDLAARVDIEGAATALGLSFEPSAGVSVERRWFQPATVRRTRSAGTDETESAVEDRRTTLGGAAYLASAARAGRSRLEVGLRLGWLSTGDATFTALQPRLAASTVIGGLDLSASAGRTWQPLHLLSNPGVGLPTDLWVPATPDAPPASAWQGAVSIGRTSGSWSGSVGAFYKTMDGLVEYADGAGFFTSGERWESDVVAGSGRAYGVELAFARTGRRHEARAAYALSRSTRSFSDIGGGEAFPYRYDRTHDLSVAVTRHVSERRRLTALFVYATGAAVTVPTARVGVNAYLYGPRNGARLPAYHRLDLAYEVDYGRGRLALGVSNAYNRLNPYFAEYEFGFGDGADLEVKDRVRYVALFPVLPSISYRFVL